MYFIWYQSANYVPADLRPIEPQKLASSVGGWLENAHYVMFGILYILLVFASLTFGKLSWRKEWICIVISVLYAVSDEVHQYYIPYRSMSMNDLYKDGVGIVAAWLTIRYVYYRRPASAPSAWMRSLQPK